MWEKLVNCIKGGAGGGGAPKKGCQVVLLSDLMKQVPPDQQMQFKLFAKKHEEYKARVRKYPESLPAIDWEYYRKNVRPELVEWVNQYETKYDKLHSLFENRHAIVDHKRYFELVDKESEEVRKEIDAYKEASNERIKQLTEKMEFLKDLKPYDQMTMEEFCFASPHLAPDYINKPTFWPHTPEEQLPGPADPAAAAALHEEHEPPEPKKPPPAAAEKAAASEKAATEEAAPKEPSESMKNAEPAASEFAEKAKAVAKDLLAKATVLLYSLKEKVSAIAKNVQKKAEAAKAARAEAADKSSTSASSSPTTSPCQETLDRISQGESGSNICTQTIIRSKENDAENPEIKAQHSELSSEAEPCGVDPCKVDPCGVDPCKVDPCKGDPCEADPCKVDSCEVDPCKVDPCKEDPCKVVDPCKVDSCNVDPCKEDPCKVDSSEVDPCKVDPCKADPCEADPCKADSLEVDPCKVDPYKVDPCKVDPCKVDPCKVDPCKVDSCEVDPCKVDPGKVDPCKVDPCEVVDPCKVVPCKVDPCKVDPCEVVDPCKVDLSKVDPCKVDPCEVVDPCKVDPCEGEQNRIRQKTRDVERRRQKEEARIYDTCKPKQEESDRCKPKQEESVCDPCKPQKEESVCDPCKLKEEPDPCKPKEDESCKNEKDNDPSKPKDTEHKSLDSKEPEQVFISISECSKEVQKKNEEKSGDKPKECASLGQKIEGTDQKSIMGKQVTESEDPKIYEKTTIGGAEEVGPVYTDPNQIAQLLANEKEAKKLKEIEATPVEEAPKPVDDKPITIYPRREISAKPKDQYETKKSPEEMAKEVYSAATGAASLISEATNTLDDLKRKKEERLEVMEQAYASAQRQAVGALAEASKAVNTASELAQKVRQTTGEVSSEDQEALAMAEKHALTAKMMATRAVALKDDIARVLKELKKKE